MFQAIHQPSRTAFQRKIGIVISVRTPIWVSFCLKVLMKMLGIDPCNQFSSMPMKMIRSVTSSTASWIMFGMDSTPARRDSLDSQA